MWNLFKFRKKLKAIKVFMVDVDGILTDGKVYYDGMEVGFNRFFHVHDGHGMKLLREAGIKIGMISGGDSLGLRERAKYLKVDYLFTNREDKRYALEQLNKDGFPLESILYMGDELFDIPLLKVVGFSATVPSAIKEVKKVVDYITKKDAGNGGVREVADMVRKAQNLNYY